MKEALAVLGVLLLLAAPVAAVVWLPRFLDAYAVTRRAEKPQAVLYARLTQSHRELPGRPSAAATAPPVYEITDLPGHKARASKER